MCCRLVRMSASARREAPSVPVPRVPSGGNARTPKRYRYPIPVEDTPSPYFWGNTGTAGHPGWEQSAVDGRGKYKVCRINRAL